MGGFIGDAFVHPGLPRWPGAHRPGLHPARNRIWLGLDRDGHRSRSRPSSFPAIATAHPAASARQRQITASASWPGGSASWSTAAVEIQAHDTTNYERADHRRAAGKDFLRFATRSYQRKFFVKFLNNLLVPVHALRLLRLGRRAAGDLMGHLDIGALVAVIAAYKDLPGPIKELIDWEQNRARRADQIRPGHSSSSSRATMIDPDPGRPSTTKPVAPLKRRDGVASAMSLLDENDFKLVWTRHHLLGRPGPRAHLAIVGHERQRQGAMSR